MITEPNYQPEPPSNQPSDIEDGLGLTKSGVWIAALTDLVAAVGEVLEHPGECENPHSTAAIDDLENAYNAYLRVSKNLEEM